MLRLLIIFLLTMTFDSGATTFRRMPLDQLVGESTAAAEVKLISKQSYMNKMGLILTEHIFQVTESFNLENDLDGEFLKLEMTGGTVNGLTSFIDGAPEFSPGEKSFLLLKKIDNKLYLSNFTLGKYKVVQEGEEVFYVSSVFPKDPDMGKVSRDRMIEVIKEKFRISSVPTVKNENNKISKSLSPAKDISLKREPSQEFTKNLPVRSLIIWSLGTFTIALILGISALKKETIE